MLRVRRRAPPLANVDVKTARSLASVAKTLSAGEATPRPVPDCSVAHRPRLAWIRPEQTTQAQAAKASVQARIHPGPATIGCSVAREAWVRLGPATLAEASAQALAVLASYGYAA